MTAARDNIVIELDGRPAYEVFAEAAGPLADDLRRALTYVFVAIPVYENADTIERGQFVVRNIVGASEEHGVIAVAFQPKVGDAIGFVLRDAERSRQDLKATLDDLNDRLDNKPPPAFGLYFNCVSRGAGLYNIPGHDSAYIRTRTRPGPDRRLLHRFRNRLASRANLAAPILRRPRADLGKEISANLRGLRVPSSCCRRVLSPALVSSPSVADGNPEFFLNARRRTPTAERSN